MPPSPTWCCLVSALSSPSLGGFPFRAVVALLVALLVLPGFAVSGGGSSASAMQSDSEKLRVVVISVDAARFDHLLLLASQGHLPNIARMLSNGVYSNMVVVFPTATAVSHAAISTGAPPGVNGIVGNSIHLPNTTITTTRSGFDGRLLRSEPIWVAADRQGVRTIVVSFPQSTPPAWNVTRSLLFNIYDASVGGLTSSTLYTTNRNVAAATYISFEEAKGWANVDRAFGYVVKALESSIRVGDTTWFLYLADLDGDGAYDRVAIAPEKDLAKAYAILREGEWSKPINATVTAGGRTYTIAPLFKAVKLNPVGDFRLYRGTTRPLETPWFNNVEAARSVWNNVITKTSTFTDGDWFGLTRGWFDEETYMETVYYTNKFFMEWTLFMMKNYDWDLILTYTPVVDNVYHQFLGLADPSMPYYNAEKAKHYWELIVRTYKMVDEFVGVVLNNVPPRTAVIMISDHGQVPIKKIVHINGILYNRGYIAVDEAFRVDVRGTKAYAPWHSHIFINLAGREAQGVVGATEYSSLVEEIVRMLREYRDPDTGERVFDLVLTREEAEILGLGGERTGDIVFALKPGYTSSTALVRDRATGKAVEIAPATPLVTVTGDHGPHLPHYKELHGVFLAVGPGISGGYLGAVSSLQVAPTIAALLGIKPPSDSKHSPILTVKEVKTTITATVTNVLTTTMVTTREVTTTTVREVTRTTTLTDVRTTTMVEQRTATVFNTLTLTSPVTVTESRLDVGTAGLVAIAMLLAGLVVGFLVFRRG